MEILSDEAEQAGKELIDLFKEMYRRRFLKLNIYVRCSNKWAMYYISFDTGSLLAPVALGKIKIPLVLASPLHI